MFDQHWADERVLSSCQVLLHAVWLLGNLAAYDTEAQVSALRPLADQMSTAVEQMLARQPSPAQTRLMQALSDSTVVVDEAAVRADYCAQAGRQADYIIAMVRTQRRVNGILTPAQQEKAMAFQINSGVQMMQAFLGAQEKH